MGWLYAMAGLMLACCMTGEAQEKGNWRAVSSTARSITGDVSISDTKISISFAGFAIAQIRALKPSEISAAFDTDSGAGGSGSLYRLNVPGTTRFQHKNTLCGSENTQWMATYVMGHSLSIAFFSGQSVPVFTPEAIGSTTDLCGIYSYVR